MAKDVDTMSKDTLDRRQLLSGGMIAGAGLLLAACQRPITRQTRLPDPVWPDQDPNLRPRPTAPPPPQRVIVSEQPAIDTSVPTGVLPRSAWTSAKPYRGVAEPMNGVQRITVHHTAINSVGLFGRSDVARQIEAIRRGHVGRGSQWADIGYHYIVDPAGRVWEGRPIDLQGAHVREHNEHNLGVVVMGNFDEHKPTREALMAVDQFVVAQMARFRVPVQRVYTHQELMPSECPGRNLQRYMLASRSGTGAIRTAHA